MQTLVSSDRQSWFVLNVHFLSPLYMHLWTFFPPTPLRTKVHSNISMNLFLCKVLQKVCRELN